MISDTITEIELNDLGKIISLKGRGTAKDFKEVRK